jgi:hypothetical protein
VHSVAAAGGALVVTRRLLRVRDHGTGLGGAVADALGSDLHTDGHGEVDDAGTIDVELRPAPPSEAGADLVQVAIGFDGATEPARHGSAAPAVADLVLSALTRHHLDADRVHPRLHGGAVVDADGRALLVLGASGAGKSTLVAHLAASGLGLVNDEQLAVHRDQGVIAGFTRPVAIKRSGVGHLPSTVRAPASGDPDVVLLRADDLGSRRVLTGRPVLIVLPERGEPGDQVSWRQLGAPAAVAALCEHNLDLEDRPVRALEDFAWLVSRAPVVRLGYDDAAEAVPQLLALLDAPPEAPRIEWALHVEPDGGSAPPVTPRSARRVVGAHTLEVGADVVVLDPSLRTAVHLDATGAAVWWSLPWHDVAPPDERLWAFVEELALLGLVELGPAS